MFKINTGQIEVLLRNSNKDQWMRCKAVYMNAHRSVQLPAEKQSHPSKFFYNFCGMMCSDHVVSRMGKANKT